MLSSSALSVLMRPIPPLVPDTQSAGCTREDWNKALFTALKTYGLDKYLKEDFPDDDMHRDKIHTVKMYLVTLSSKLHGVPRWVPALPYYSPKKLYNLIDKVILSNRRNTTHNMMVELIQFNRADFDTLEEMMLRFLYLRSRLELLGCQFSDKATMHCLVYAMEHSGAYEWKCNLWYTSMVNETLTLDDLMADLRSMAVQEISKNERADANTQHTAFAKENRQGSTQPPLPVRRHLLMHTPEA